MREKDRAQIRTDAQTNTYFDLKVKRLANSTPPSLGEIICAHTLLAGWLLSGSCLAGCLAAGWLVGWLAGWLTGQPAGLLACWHAGWLAAGQLAGWLAEWLVGWLGKV